MMPTRHPKTRFRSDRSERFVKDQMAEVRKLLDVLAVEVGAGRHDTAELRKDTAELRDEMRSGFGRVERRLGNLGNRVEGVETELCSFRAELARHRSSF